MKTSIKNLPKDKQEELENAVEIILEQVAAEIICKEKIVTGFTD